ncbi:hypothetical protein ACWJJH_14325 [Endozoicomonadaceae bacterium StTr2]
MFLFRIFWGVLFSINFLLVSNVFGAYFRVSFDDQTPWRVIYIVDLKDYESDSDPGLFTSVCCPEGSTSPEPFAIEKTGIAAYVKEYLLKNKRKYQSSRIERRPEADIESVDMLIVSGRRCYPWYFVLDGQTSSTYFNFYWHPCKGSFHPPKIGAEVSFQGLLDDSVGRCFYVASFSSEKYPDNTEVPVPDDQREVVFCYGYAHVFRFESHDKELEFDFTVLKGMHPVSNEPYCFFYDGHLGPESEHISFKKPVIILEANLPSYH